MIGRAKVSADAEQILGRAQQGVVVERLTRRRARVDGGATTRKGIGEGLSHTTKTAVVPARYIGLPTTRPNHPANQRSPTATAQLWVSWQTSGTTKRNVGSPPAARSPARAPSSGVPSGTSSEAQKRRSSAPT